MGGEGKGSGNGTSQPAAHLPFFSPLAAHHSAKRDSVERNLLAIYDLRKGLWPKISGLKSLRFTVCDLRMGKKETAERRFFIQLRHSLSDSGQTTVYGYGWF